ncbi:agarase [Rhodopseudomonas sp. HC1]|uniref:agarase n=1 Tax=Rhodopseudomonas infernalis TaxID=2897386 RepID=UPI001EE89547|nr:agarase [Rhodopseudomonas infernalis]MCG6203496.1 agarase [Rhodopseudomonas infernalis]
MTCISRTRWGGLATCTAKATGFFRVARIDGVWWFIDPDGGRFLSKGVVSVQLDHDNIKDSERRPYREACLRRYGSRDAWRQSAADRLHGWGFNTVGAWSEPEVARAGAAPLASAAGVLYLAAAYGEGRGWPQSDLFDPAFERFAQQRTQQICGPVRDDASVLGWFIDNELPWGPDWRGENELLPGILRDTAAPYTRRAAVALLRERYKDITAFNEAWLSAMTSWEQLASQPVSPPPFNRNFFTHDHIQERDVLRARYFADCDAFAGLLAERYFAVSAAAIRAAAPHHLVLGSRFAYVPPPQVIAAAGRHCDVISINCYDALPGATIEAYAATGRPCLIGEFSFRGDDAGLPNTHGAGPRVETQADRAAGFARYVGAGLRHPNLVGYHWFLHADQPAEGRWDGEDSNYGVVTINDDVYPELTEAMRVVNDDAEWLHEAAGSTARRIATAPAA